MSAERMTSRERAIVAPSSNEGLRSSVVSGRSAQVLALVAALMASGCNLMADGLDGVCNGTDGIFCTDDWQRGSSDDRDEDREGGIEIGDDYQKAEEIRDSLIASDSDLEIAIAIYDENRVGININGIPYFFEEVADDNVTFTPVDDRAYQCMTAERDSSGDITLRPLACDRD